MSRLFDICIFGGTGFTAKYVISNLVKVLSVNPTSLNISIGIRDLKKFNASLPSFKEQFGMDISSIPTIIADTRKPDSLAAMARKSKLVINCTGPFWEHGEPVVQACVHNGAHYIDITGEPLFMELMQLKYHDEALKKDVYVIPACGFDCIPTDVGVTFLKDNFKGKLSTVESFVSGIGSITANETTFYSALEGFSQTKLLVETRKSLYHKMFSAPLKVKTAPLKERPLFSKYSDGSVSGYCLPFHGADRSVVKRTQMHNHILFNEGDFVSFKTYMVQSWFRCLQWTMFAIGFKLLIPYEWGRRLLKNNPTFFSAGITSPVGPSIKEVNGGSFAIILRGKGRKEGNESDPQPMDEVIARVEGPHPGYPACAWCINQAAITLLEETEKLPLTGGVYTPGTAFRKTSLVQRLNQNGIPFKMVKS